MKKLIFCFDGTSNDPDDAGDYADDSSITNILKLHILLGGTLKNNAKPQNVGDGNNSFYYSGIGTRGSVLKQYYNRAAAPPHSDMENILSEARRDLEQHYQEGDEIHIFGFSRGAAIARIFAARHVNNRAVRFVGVFDTVAAIRGKGLDLDPRTFPASGVLFENGNIGEHIGQAVRLVAIDEKRIAFQPTLFNKSDRVTEVWMAGAHADVGGGYWFDGLSDVALSFMMSIARKSGLAFKDVGGIAWGELTDETDEEIICRDDVAVMPFFDGKNHEQRRGRIAKKLTLYPRKLRVNGADDEPLTDEPPLIHHSVIDRFNKVRAYRPVSLRNLRFRVVDKDGGVSDKIYHGIEGMRE